MECGEKHTSALAEQPHDGVASPTDQDEEGNAGVELDSLGIIRVEHCVANRTGSLDHGAVQLRFRGHSETKMRGGGGGWGKGGEEVGRTGKKWGGDEMEEETEVRCSAFRGME
jgi:hypothetical protein